MKKLHDDDVNPFVLFEVEKDAGIPIPPNTTELHINLCYLKPDGSLDNRPSVAFVLQDKQRNRFCTQITLETLKPVIDRLIELDFESDDTVEPEILAAYAERVGPYLRHKRERIVS